MKILALDTAPTAVGWAAGDSASRPAFGVRTFPSCGGKCGRLSTIYCRWLWKMLKLHTPDLVMFEQPLIFPGTRMTGLDHYKTLGMAWSTEHTVASHDPMLPCDWIAIGTIKKHFTGNGKAQKVDMMFTAKQLGYKVTDHNEADALAVFSYAACHNDPDHAENWMLGVSA